MGLEGLNEDLGLDFILKYMKDGETEISLRELLIRSSLSETVSL